MKEQISLGEFTADPLTSFLPLGCWNKGWGPVTSVAVVMVGGCVIASDSTKPPLIR